jgi:hypothetical protein
MRQETTAVDAVIRNLNSADLATVRRVDRIDRSVIDGITGEEVIVGIFNGSLCLVSIANYGELNHAYASRRVDG